VAEGIRGTFLQVELSHEKRPASMSNVKRRKASIQPHPHLLHFDSRTLNFTCPAFTPPFSSPNPKSQSLSIMDPISIAGLVCAIVSAFTGAASLFKERKASKKEKAEKEKGAAALRKSLAVAPPQVQREYDQDFSRIGQPFAIGDGKKPFRVGVQGGSHSLANTSRYWAQSAFGDSDRPSDEDDRDFANTAQRGPRKLFLPSWYLR
jgi:hypothetical protein